MGPRMKGYLLSYFSIKYVYTHAKKKATLRVAMVRLLCIHVIQGTLRGQRFVDEVIHLHMSCRYIGLLETIFYVRPCNITRNHLQAVHVNTLDWPSGFPDLSQIKHVWDMLGRWVCDFYPFPAATLSELQC